jgi:hypothetical protein
LKKKKVGGVAQRLARGHVLVVARVLRQVAHALANLHIVVHDIVPEDRGATSCWSSQAQQQLDRGGLARAVGAEETEDGILGDGEVERLERAYFFVRLAQAVRVDDKIGGSHMKLLSR